MTDLSTISQIKTTLISCYIKNKRGGLWNTVQDWSSVRIILSVSDSALRKQDKRLGVSVSSKYGIVLGMCFSAHPR